MSETERHVARTITMSVGGVHTHFESIDPELSFRVTFPRTRFLTNCAEPECWIQGRIGNADPGGGSPSFGAGGVWDVRDGELGGDRVVFYTRTSQDRRVPLMRLDLTSDLSRGELVWERRFALDRVLELGFPLDEYLAARLLARRGGTIVHASCLVDGDSALVFYGHSGAGKSTVARMGEVAGLTVLSDDRTVLLWRNGSLYAAGTPWHGSQMSGVPECVPVAGLFLLQQASVNRILPIGQSRAFAELLVRTVRPLASVDEQSQVIETLHAIVRAVPSAVFEFEPNRHALEAARELVASRIKLEPRSS